MSYISDLLTQTVAPRIQPGLQPHLRRFYGGIIRNYLPQVWWFETETGSATVYVAANGVASVFNGHSGNPDVLVKWTDADAFAALTATNPSSVPTGTRPPRVAIRTSKGGAAYNQLKKRLGL